MKKILFFLIIITSFIFLPKTYAKTYKFYEDTYIDGIYMNKNDPSTKTTYYQKARFFRQADNYNFAYCIEPFNFFQQGSAYNETYYPTTLSESQRKNISALAHYGYGYTNHNDEKWYAITQLLIWKEADPNGDYYFTDTLNGNRINPFDNEINELLTLVNNSYLKPSFNSQTFHIVKGQDLVITDTNNIINQYTSQTTNAKINGNTVTITGLNEGSHQISFTRSDNTASNKVTFFQATDSQALVEIGNLDYTYCTIRISVDTNKITLKKVDKDTKTTEPIGEAVLDGVVYELLNSKKEKIKTITFKNNEATIENLEYGTYYLKEIKAGEGYTINKDLIEFTVSYEKRDKTITLENEVIKSKLKIYKEYGEDDNFHPEANIEFNIYNSKKELIKTITTDETGYAELELPYGTYYLEQNNTTEGYEKIEPFIFKVKDTEPLIYKLKNYKIEVPDTKTTSNSFISFLLNLLC